MTGPRHTVGTSGSLVRVEVQRLTSRTFVRLVAGLALLGFLVLAVVAFTQFSRPTPEILAEAAAQQQAELELSEQYRQQCLDDPNIPAEQREFACGPEVVADDLQLEYYIDKQPFTLGGDLPAGGVAVAAAAAMIGFVVGATFVGAEWSTRSIVALLFWEPRRLKVIGVKTGVTAVAAAAFAVVSQFGWLGLGLLLARFRGTTEVEAGFWADLAGQGARSVLLVVLATLLGFGLANLIRNTGAALGIAFAYFAVVETALRNLLPTSQPFLISDSSAAFVVQGGLRLFLPGTSVDTGTGFIEEYTEYIVTNLRGGLTLTAYTLVLLAVGTWLFRRRDLH